MPAPTPAYASALQPFMSNYASPDPQSLDNYGADYLRQRFLTGGEPASVPAQQSPTRIDVTRDTPYYTEGEDQINKAFINRELAKLHRRGIGPGDLSPEESADRFGRLKGAASVMGMAGGLAPAAGIIGADFYDRHADDPNWKGALASEAVPIAAQMALGPAARAFPKTTGAMAGATIGNILGGLGSSPEAEAEEQQKLKDVTETDERQKAIDRLWQDAQPRTIPPDLDQRINELTQRAADKSVSAKLAQQWRTEAAKMRDDWQQQENDRQAAANKAAQVAAGAYAGDKDAQAKAIADAKLTFAHQHPVINDTLNAAGYAVAAGLPAGRRLLAMRSASKLENRANTLADEWKATQETVNNKQRYAKSTVDAARKNAALTASELKATEPRIKDELTAANPAEGFRWGNPSTYGKLVPNPAEAGLGGLAFYEGRALPHQIDYATLPAGNTQRDEAARWTPFSGKYDLRLLGTNMAQGAGANMFGRDFPLPKGGASLPRIENIITQPQYRRSSWNKDKNAR